MSGTDHCPVCGKPGVLCKECIPDLAKQAVMAYAGNREHGLAKGELVFVKRYVPTSEIVKVKKINDEWVTTELWIKKPTWIVFDSFRACSCNGWWLFGRTQDGGADAYFDKSAILEREGLKGRPIAPSNGF